MRLTLPGAAKMAGSDLNRARCMERRTAGSCMKLPPRDRIRPAQSWDRRCRKQEWQSELAAGKGGSQRRGAAAHFDENVFFCRRDKSSPHHDGSPSSDIDAGPGELRPNPVQPLLVFRLHQHGTQASDLSRSAYVNAGRVEPGLRHLYQR
jgi:hypothetical protein